LTGIAATNAQVILDPFMGSGTTAMAAESCGREWVGMELSGDYCKLAKERILAAKGLFRNDPATPTVETLPNGVRCYRVVV
jgi:modification methylase